MANLPARIATKIGSFLGRLDSAPDRSAAIVTAGDAKDFQGPIGALGLYNTFSPITYSGSNEAATKITTSNAINSALWAGLTVLGKTFPAIRMRLVDADGSEVTDHKINDLLERPDIINGLSQRDLLLHLIQYMAVGGVGYIDKQPNDAQGIAGLHPYHVGNMRPVQGSDRWVKEYQYLDRNGLWQTVPGGPDRIIEVRWPSVNFAEPWKALSPLAPVAMELGIDEEVSRFIGAILTNGAVPLTVVSLDDAEASAEARKAFRADFEQNYGGANRGRTFVTGNKTKVDRLGMTFNELAVQPIRDTPEARIVAALGVPAILAGLNVGLARSTFSNTAEARRYLTEQTLVPLWDITADALTEGLSDAFGLAAEGLRIAPDLTKVEALQESVDAKAKRAIDGYKGGVVTRNESRRMLGLPDIEGEDTFISKPDTSTPNTSPQP